MLAEDGLERSARTASSPLQEARVACERALALDLQFEAAWTNKGDAFHELKRFEEALGTYDQALTLEPNEAFRWTRKGIALRALGRVAEAEQAERQAKELELGG